MSTLFWSGNFVIGRAARFEVPPIGLSFWRWAVALIIFLPFAWRHVVRQWQLLVKSWKIIVLLGILGIANFNTFVYIGLQSTTATNAVIIVSTTPIIIVVLSRFLHGDKITFIQGLGIIISLFGVITIVSRGNASSLLAFKFSVGDFWIMAAVLSWALYSVMLKWCPAGMHSLSLLAGTAIVGVAVLAPFYVWETWTGITMRLNFVTFSIVLYVSFFASVLAIVFWNHAVARVGANRAGQFMHLVPANGIMLSMFFLSELMKAFHLVGISLILLGIYMTKKVGSSGNGLKHKSLNN
jgi:drug/metabolite transporter (DMT)-like permease